MEIRITKGLQIPIDGAATSSDVRSVPLGEFAIDFRPFSHMALSTSLVERCHVPKQGVMATEIQSPHRCVTAPIDLKVLRIVRGERRKLCEIVCVPLERSSPIDPQRDLLEKDRDFIIEHLRSSGLLCVIKMRPFGVVCDPTRPPRSIFVQALETAPYTPSTEMQIAGRENIFVMGLRLLHRIAPGATHLVTTPNSPCETLGRSAGVQVHTINARHPSSSPSIAIQKIDPIRSLRDSVWTATALDTMTLGAYCLSGDLWIDRIVARAGSPLAPTERAYMRAYPGASVASLLDGVSVCDSCRIISGNPLTGEKVERSSFLRQDHTVLSLVQEPLEESSMLMPFARLSVPQYTATDTYFQPIRRLFRFSTLTNGELRNFIDSSVYDMVIPFDILTVPMLKAIIGKDFDKALQYGLLEIVPEDLALADFICPSKIGMMAIVREGQHECLSMYTSPGPGIGFRT